MAASSLAAALHRIAEIQARLPGPVAVVIGLVALGVALLPEVWLLSRHVTVMAHEGAHAVMGSIMGHRINAVRIMRNADGVTETSGGGTSSLIAVGAIGYLGPSLFGLGAAELIRTGHVIAVLWAGLVALLLLMVPLRRSFGVATVVAAFVLLYLLARYGTVAMQVMAAYGLAWFMLLSGVRVIRLRGKDAADAYALNGLTRLPRGFWSSLWLTGSVVALAFGGVLLL